MEFVCSAICWVVGLGLAATAMAFSFAGSLNTKAAGLAVLISAGIVCWWARTCEPRTKFRLSAMFISTILTLLIAEVLLRVLTLFPVNTDSNMIPHPDLGYVLDPELGDVDANGFRNPRIPTQADIVAIGDSHTQGINSESRNSWPQRLGRWSNQSVYNMGVGGYGPLQYEKLIWQALRLRPRQIIVGLYVGNDLGDVTRGIRQRHSEREIDNRFRHFVKYHTAVGSAVTQLVKRSVLGRPAGFSINHRRNPTFIGDQRVQHLLRDVDLSDTQIAAATARTIERLSAASRKCADHGVRLVVMLIPTREAVYFHSMQNQRELWPSAFRQLADREAVLRSHLHTALASQQVESIDVLPFLVQALESESGVYSSHDEGHPLAAGYRAYARAALEWTRLPATN